MTAAPEAVFFDWDGTLVDTLPFLFSAHNHVREVMGFPRWSLGEFKGHVRYSSRELYGPLYGARADEALEALARFMEENHLHNLSVLPDSLALLDCLKAARLPAGIVSNKRHPFLLREIEHLGWQDRVQIAIGAGHAARDKPAAEPLLLALSECEISPGPAVWYVGDSETDMLTAREAGCSAILIRHHHDNAYLASQYGPLHCFDDCTDMIAYLSAILTDSRQISF